MIFVPLIVIYAVYLAARMLMPGGGLDQAYDASAPTLAALGLTETERPKVEIQTPGRRAAAAAPRGGRRERLCGRAPRPRRDGDASRADRS